MEKGKTNNPFGRPKGTPNKVTAEAKEAIKNIVNDYLDGKVFEDLDIVDPVTRLNVMVKLAAYIVPKERDVNMRIDKTPQLGGKLGEMKKMTLPQLLAAYPELFEDLVTKKDAEPPTEITESNNMIGKTFVPPKF